MFEDLEQPPLMRLSLKRADDYDIVTALRGPDSGEELVLKYLTTCVIRWFVGMRYPGRKSKQRDPGCLIMSPSEASSQYTRSGAWQWRKSFHFPGHTQKAFAALIHKRVPGSAEYWAWLSQKLVEEPAE